MIVNQVHVCFSRIIGEQAHILIYSVELSVKFIDFLWAVKLSKIELNYLSLHTILFSQV